MTRQRSPLETLAEGGVEFLERQRSSRVTARGPHGSEGNQLRPCREEGRGQQPSKRKLGRRWPVASPCLSQCHLRDGSFVEWFPVRVPYAVGLFEVNCLGGLTMSAILLWVQVVRPILLRHLNLTKLYVATISRIPKIPTSRLTVPLVPVSRPSTPSRPARPPLTCPVLLCNPRLVVLGRPNMHKKIPWKTVKMAPIYDFPRAARAEHGHGAKKVLAGVRFQSVDGTDKRHLQLKSSGKHFSKSPNGGGVRRRRDVSSDRRHTRSPDRFEVALLALCWRCTGCSSTLSLP